MCRVTFRSCCVAVWTVVRRGGHARWCARIRRRAATAIPVCWWTVRRAACSLFHAASVRQGFAGARTGNRDDDPNVLHADVSWSDDDGHTWRHRRLTSQVKDSSWGGLFATSGSGIQLQRGAHVGRLVQQFVDSRARCELRCESRQR
jgi:hypothetical protein